MTDPRRDPVFAPDDLRAAVAAGVINEAQAAGVLALAQRRLGLRGAMTRDEEPFELFKGFNEIFVAVGLAIFFAGLAGLTVLGQYIGGGVGGFTMPVGFVGAAAAWLFAEYLTLRRRMVLPSALLALAFAASCLLIVVGWWLPTDLAGAADVAEGNWRNGPLLALGAGAAAALAFFIRFGLPFSLFVGAGFTLAGLLFYFGPARHDSLLAFDPVAFFSLDLGRSGSAAPVMLGFGLACFALAMWFDMKDPHRVSRYSACGFWLHVAAAVAIVNTVAISLSASGGVMLPLALAGLALTAVIIDRRSFLTTALVYATPLAFAAADAGASFTRAAMTLIVVGLLVIGLGAGWARIRGALMRALPNFPGKTRLPPWS